MMRPSVARVVVRLRVEVRMQIYVSGRFMFKLG